MNAVRFLVPAGIDDWRRVSGGNVYDRRVRDGLRHRGWDVAMAEAADGAEAAAALRATPDGAIVLIDGLVAGWAPDDVADHAARVRIVVLAHMISAAFPEPDEHRVTAERIALASARRVIATSRWTAGELERLGLARRVVVAPPGIDRVPVADPGAAGELLCVGVIAAHKGQDTLLAALARVPEHDWTCTIAGGLDAHPAFAAGLSRTASADPRVTLTGVLAEADLAGAYRHAAVLVAPSRVESAGMAIGEARARGIPVIAAAVGGIPDTTAGGGAILVPPGDPDALAEALGAWMSDPALRARLRAESLRARDALPTWDDAVDAIAAVLAETRETACGVSSERSESR